MAYILGYFVADGAMIRNKRGAHFIEFHSVDRVLIRRVRSVLGSNHRIGVRKVPGGRSQYRVQIGSIALFTDLRVLGLSQNKSKTVRLPVIPREYFCHFVRGYFDGDGNVYFKKHFAKDRQKIRWVFSTRFTCGSMAFLADLHANLKQHGISKGSIVLKSNKRGYELIFSHADSLALYALMYDTAHDTALRLSRKHRVFTRAIRTLYPLMRV